jgi:hypothetical protein
VLLVEGLKRIFSRSDQYLTIKVLRLILSFNGFLKIKIFNRQNIFEIIPLEVGSFVLITIEIKKSLIIVFINSFELFK